MCDHDVIQSTDNNIWIYEERIGFHNLPSKWTCNVMIGFRHIDNKFAFQIYSFYDTPFDLRCNICIGVLHWTYFICSGTRSKYIGDDIFVTLTPGTLCDEGYIHGSLARNVQLRAAHAPGMPRKFSPPPRVNDPDIHHGTCVANVPWCLSGTVTNGFLWIRWRGKRSPHSRCMRNPQFCVSVKGPMGELSQSLFSEETIVHVDIFSHTQWWLCICLKFIKSDLEYSVTVVWYFHCVWNMLCVSHQKDCRL